MGKLAQSKIDTAWKTFCIKVKVRILTVIHIGPCFQHSHTTTKVTNLLGLLGTVKLPDTGILRTWSHKWSHKWTWSQKVENQDVWCVCAHGYKTNLINVSTWYIVKYPYYFCSSSILENTLKLKTGRERVQYYLKKCPPKLTKMYFLQHSRTQPQKEPHWTPSLQREALLRHRTSSTLQATPLHHPSWNERAIVQSTIFLDLKVRASQNMIGNRLLVNHWLYVGHSLSGEKHSVFTSTTL